MTKNYFLFMIMKEVEMLRFSEDKMLKLESDYPGIREEILRFENAVLPICSFCGSTNTANVQVGINGRTIAITAATTKFKLFPNGPKKGSYFCNDCTKYFS
jgi:hypothetical protein